jgi:hypothetical protein
VNEAQAIDAEDARLAKIARQRRSLRIAAWASLSLPLLWMILVGLAGRVVPSAPVSSLRFALVPVWIMLAAVGAYYLHVLLTLFRPGVTGFAALGAAWGAGSVVAFAMAGVEAGVTVVLALAALLSFVHTWGKSVTEFLDLRGPAARAGLVVLCVAVAVSPAILAAGGVAILLGNFSFSSVVCDVGAPLVAVSLGIPGLLFLLSLRARKAARRRVDNARGEEEPAPDPDGPPAGVAT